MDDFLRENTKIEIRFFSIGDSVEGSIDNSVIKSCKQASYTLLNACKKFC